MSTLDRAVELLDRALGYTRVALNDIGDDDLGLPTPCAGWDLGRLLRHMDDALDAFTEGAGGAVSVTSPGGAEVTVRSLQGKACALLGTWSGDAPQVTRVGPVGVDTAVLVRAAALEITVHGWDVASTLGAHRGPPEALAERLLPVAAELVAPSDRGQRFAAPLPARPTDPADRRLLAFVGRDPAWSPAG